jgi:hypothetical protein
MLRFDPKCALWAEREIDLTLTEFRIVILLAEKVGQDVGYREIYDIVHGAEAVAKRNHPIGMSRSKSMMVGVRSSVHSTVFENLALSRIPAITATQYCAISLGS